MCTGGGAGARAVVNLSSTDYGEIIIFGLSKDQTIRNWSTLMDLEQFLILVTYLFITFGYSPSLELNIYQILID